MQAQIFMGKSLTFALQRKMQNITDNISNVETAGHKRKIMEMESLFPQVMERVIAEFEDPNVPIGHKKTFYPEFGTAMRIAEITKDMKQGGLNMTNRELDVAVQGEGFLQFRMPDGTTVYGRAGNLKQTHDGLVTDVNSHPIEPELRIPANVKTISIRETGEVFVLEEDGGKPRPVGQILLAKFNNPEHLRSIGQNLYRATPDSGEPSVGAPRDESRGSLHQGALETANINIIEEMVDMLHTQRMFELMVGAIGTGVEIVKTSQDIPK
jgi:flagellar basal-body rod protein FlgG